MKKDKYLNILIGMYIILLPIFDIASYITQVMISKYSFINLLRPLILGVILLLLFLNHNKKARKGIILFNLVLLFYSVIHLLIYKNSIDLLTIYPLKEELRLLAFYGFSSNLFINVYYYYKDNKFKIKYPIVPFIISSLIYNLNLYLTYIFKLSSYTYFDSKTGFKGWFLSGNVLSVILLLMEGILLSIIASNKVKNNIKYIAGLSYVLIFNYSIVLLGTRTGRYGSLLIMFVFLVLEFIRLLKIRSNKNKLILKVLLFIITLSTIVYKYNYKFLDSYSKSRRNFLEEKADDKNLHVTPTVHDLNIKIKKGEVKEENLSKIRQKSLVETEEIASKKKLKSHDRRSAQTIYNYLVIKNSKSISKIIFGKGHLLSYGEMILERELLVIIMDYGLLGSILFLMPYLLLICYLGIRSLKYIKELNTSFYISLFSLSLSFLLSYFMGTVLFPMTSSFLIASLLFIALDNLKEVKEEPGCLI